MDAFLETALFSHVGVPTIAVRLVAAAVLAAIIGLEREWNDHAAGFRSHILVCVAAASFALITIELVHAPVFGDGNIRMDPMRLVEAVTAGVAFLAAGFIVLLKGEVRGVTTGAGLWLAGATGLACGLGLFAIAILATIVGFATLRLLHIVERKIVRGREGR
ncbi:MAG: MgtC/SapB family protein [Beijerinckiaceae bacterium]